MGGCYDGQERERERLYCFAEDGNPRSVGPCDCGHSDLRSNALDLLFDDVFGGSAPGYGGYYDENALPTRLAAHAVRALSSVQIYGHYFCGDESDVY